MSDGDHSISDLSSRERVLEAIAEYDRLGGPAFLTRYGYGPSRRYRLRFSGKL